MGTTGTWPVTDEQLQAVLDGPPRSPADRILGIVVFAVTAAAILVAMASVALSEGGSVASAGLGLAGAAAIGVRLAQGDVRRVAGGWAFRVSAPVLWYAVEAAIGAVVVIAGAVFVVGMLTATVADSFGDTLAQVAFRCGFAAVCALVAFGLVAPYRIRIVVDGHGIHQRGLVRTRSVTWPEVRRVVLEREHEAILTLFGPITRWVGRRLVAGFERRYGDLGFGWRVHRVEMVDGRTWRLGRQWAMELDVAVRLAAAVAQEARRTGIGVSADR